jgi:chromosome segregation ATPase
MGNLQELINSEGNENAEAQNEVNRLRQVLDVKEVQLNEAERDLDELRNEVNAYREDAVDNDKEMKRLRDRVDEQEHRLTDALSQGANTGDARGDQQKVNELKRSNRDLKGEVESLKETINKLKVDARSVNLSEYETMQRRVKELEDALNKATTAAAGDGTILELQTRNQRLESEMDNLKEKLREASRSTASSEKGKMHGDASETYELLNDVVSQLKNDIQLLQDYINDVKKVYDSYRRIDPDTMNNTDRKRIEKDLREFEPDVTFEELDHILTECVKSSEKMKSRLLDFKEIFLS